MITQNEFDFFLYGVSFGIGVTAFIFWYLRDFFTDVKWIKPTSLYPKDGSGWNDGYSHAIKVALHQINLWFDSMPLDLRNKDGATYRLVDEDDVVKLLGDLTEEKTNG